MKKNNSLIDQLFAPEARCTWRAVLKHWPLSDKQRVWQDDFIFVKLGKEIEITDTQAITSIAEAGIKGARLAISLRCRAKKLNLLFAINKLYTRRQALPRVIESVKSRRQA